MSQTPPYPTGQPPMLQEAPGATASLVLGICSIVFSAPIIGLILGFIGLQKAKEAKSMIMANPGAYSNAGIAQAGHICSIIGLCFGILSTLGVCGTILFMALAAAIAGAAAGLIAPVF